MQVSDNVAAECIIFFEVELFCQVLTQVGTLIFVLSGVHLWGYIL